MGCIILVVWSDSVVYSSAYITISDMTNNIKSLLIAPHKPRNTYIYHTTVLMYRYKRILYAHATRLFTDIIQQLISVWSLPLKNNNKIYKKAASDCWVYYVASRVTCCLYEKENRCVTCRASDCCLHYIDCRHSRLIYNIFTEMRKCDDQSKQSQRDWYDNILAGRRFH